MSTDDERTDDPAASWRPVSDLPGQLPFDRLDYGDAEQLAELAGAGEPPTEPRQPVDEPIRITPPYDRAHKRRNQRRLPT